MYWPGFDSAGYAAAAYSQASALAAAASATSLSQSMTQSMSQSMSQSMNGMNGSPHLNVHSSSANSSPTSDNSQNLMISSSTGAGTPGGSSLSFPVHSTTPGSPKKKAQPVPDSMKDGSYWDRRKRNNESARRSREARRMKEEQIAIRVVYLEQENLQLRTEVGMLRAEIEKMRMLLYNTTTHH